MRILLNGVEKGFAIFEYWLCEECLEMLICTVSVLEFFGSFSAVIGSQVCSCYAKMKLMLIGIHKIQRFL